MGGVRLLRASAGSGKTWRLVYEYVRSVVGEPAQYAHILAVTFTNKATAEMKRRIVDEVNRLAREDEQSDYMPLLMRDLALPREEVRVRARAARGRILHDYSRFSILTIDKFFQRIIRSFIKELGIDLDFTLELKTGGLLGSAVDAVVDDISLDDALRRWITDFVEEKIEENRRWEIKSELMALGREIFGEEYRRRVGGGLHKQELERIVDEASISASATIARMAEIAKQSLRIIDDNGLSVSDFSGGSHSFANYFAKVARGEVAEPGKSVLAAVEQDDKWSARTSPRRAEILALAPQLRTLLGQIIAIYDDRHRFLNSVEILRRNYRNFALLSDLSARMETICAAENILPIAETNDIIHRLVAGNDTPFIFEKAGNYYSRLMIDEFQDTSAMQWANFLPLLRNALAQSDDVPVLLVGDVKQSIYRWRGGDWRILEREIERVFGNVIGEDLATNYRSFERVVEFNNNVMGHVAARDNRILDAELDEALSRGVIYQALCDELRGTVARAYAGHEQQAVKGMGRGYVTVTVYNKEEGAPVIEKIEELQRRGYGPGDIAILVRTRAEGVDIANQLLDHKRRAPESPYRYDVVTHEALLIDAAPVTGFILSCFKLASQPGDTLQLAIYNRWLGRAADAPLTADDMEGFEKLRVLSPEEAFEELVSRHSLGTRPTDIAYLQALHDHILAFARTTIGDLRTFARWWDENGGTLSVNIPDAGAAITISTIHKAKGLQYRAVIVPQCSWSLVPPARSIVWAEAGEVDRGLRAFPVGFSAKMKNSLMAADYYRELVMSHVDNLNIFYVAATRAEEELHLMMPHAAKPREDRIDTLVLDAVGQAREFGQPVVRESACEVKGRTATGFGSWPAEGRLRLRMPLERYSGEALSPRNYGILMHRAFENAEDAAGIERAVEGMVANGSLSRDEAARLRETIARAMANPVVGPWFDGSWEMVRRESGIIVPGGQAARRPDRVMTRGDKAVIVDYKFGGTRPVSHRTQIVEYAALLVRMGYKDVSGYLWYVPADEVQRGV